MNKKNYFLRFLKAGRRKIILSTIATSTLFPISSAIAQNGNYANISTYAMQTLKSATLDNTKKPDITSATEINLSALFEKYFEQESDETGINNVTMSVENQIFKININASGTYLLSGSNIYNESRILVSFIFADNIEANVILDKQFDINNGGSESTWSSSLTAMATLFDFKDANVSFWFRDGVVLRYPKTSGTFVCNDFNQTKLSSIISSKSDITIESGIFDIQYTYTEDGNISINGGIVNYHGYYNDITINDGIFCHDYGYSDKVHFIGGNIIDNKSEYTKFTDNEDKPLSLFRFNSLTQDFQIKKVECYKELNDDKLYGKYLSEQLYSKELKHTFAYNIGDETEPNYVMGYAFKTDLYDLNIDFYPYVCLSSDKTQIIYKYDEENNNYVKVDAIDLKELKITNINYATTYYDEIATPTEDNFDFNLIDDLRPTECGIITYKWYNGDEELSSKPTTAGTYTLHVSYDLKFIPLLSQYNSTIAEETFEITLNNTATAIEATNNAKVNVYSAEKQIVIENGDGPISIFDLSGKLYYRGDANSSKECISVDKAGIYIIHVGKYSTKVSVK